MGAAEAIRSVENAMASAITSHENLLMLFLH